ncbi:hypothetical protein Hypma_014195, partial [Hypsizygus marmoreus]
MPLTDCCLVHHVSTHSWTHSGTSPALNTIAHTHLASAVFCPSGTVFTMPTRASNYPIRHDTDSPGTRLRRHLSAGVKLANPGLTRQVFRRDGAPSYYLPRQRIHRLSSD